jgi:hypothetical protein
MTVTIIPATAEGDAFAVGDTPTIFEAAMIYAGRHPASDFLRGASLDEAEGFSFGRGRREERKPRRRSRRHTGSAETVLGHLLRAEAKS